LGGYLPLKEYDVIAVGTGSAMYVLDPIMQSNPKMKAAVIDKDEPGGICLTRGCIPSKILIYSADMVRAIEKADMFGIDASINRVDFTKVMRRMRGLIDTEIEQIRQGLSQSPNVDYYHGAAEFTGPYSMKVSGENIRSKMILLGCGSRAIIPPIKGLEDVGYLTSDTVLHLTHLPQSVAIVGGGYIAAEFGHFLSAMGAKVTLIGRNPQFLPQEEPEVSALSKREMSKHMSILTNHEVVEVSKTHGGKRLVAVDRTSGEKMTVDAADILIASGRGPTTDILHPERGGIKTDEKGWIVTDEYLETSQPNVWALGDIDGKYPFKHKANYETTIVYYNAVLKRKVKADYHAVPHAVYADPEIASVGLKEKEAIKKYGDKGVLIGFERYEDTAKGEAMGVKDCFAKVIVESDSLRIVGAHIIGPWASSLIQEIINLMYTSDQTARPLLDAMHIHPALSEVVQRAFNSLMAPEQYHHLLEHHYQLPTL
jgi:dihydrolipoamide dehydrogenase